MTTYPRTCITLAALAALAVAPAPAAEFFVATDGADANPGTSDEPFASVTRARDAVRSLVAAGLTDDVTVTIRRGTYRLRDGLAITNADSGTRAHRVTYRASRGEKVELLGGVAVEGWRTYKGGVYVADIPAGVEPNQLFENARRMTLARAPNEGYFRVEAVKEKRTAFTYREGDLDPSRWNVDGARVFIWPGHDWFSRDKPVASIDAASRTITMASRDGYDMKSGNRFYVHNVLALLDRPGECRIDLAARKLYAWPRAGRIGRGAMVIPVARHAVAIEGTRDAPVRNLRFTGLDIGVSNDHAVLVKNAEDIRFDNCLVQSGGRNGVTIVEHAQRVVICGNEIREHIQHGVSLSGLGPGGPGTSPAPDVNHHNVIEDNHIHHCGRLVGHGYGVRISQSGHNRIMHNHIHHMPRYATTIKGVRYQSLRKSRAGVTFENRHMFLHSRNNLLAYNHIHHVNTDSQDTGAMESWGPGRDNTYDHNLIYASGNTRMNLQSGFYLDDASDYFTLTNNIIYGVFGSGSDQTIYAKGIGNVIENNILVVGPTNVGAITSFFMADERCDHHAYVRNIIVFEGEAEKPKGSWGQAIGNIHDKGMTLVWKGRVPRSGRYHAWMRYGADNARWGKKSMGGCTTLAASSASGTSGPVTLQGLENTGGWSPTAWSRICQLDLRAGENTFTWVNVKGGGLSLDAICFVDDASWVPRGAPPKEPGAGKHMVVLQGELAEGKMDMGDKRSVYRFVNWSDDRVSIADANLFWKPAGDIVINKHREKLTLEQWRAVLGGKFDGASVVADPKFYDLAKRDFRLEPDSPALKLGFTPIDTRLIGLKADFPARLARK